MTRQTIEMMIQIRYIQVILPVPLGWEPLYSYEYDCESGISLAVGSRVRVRFGPKSHVGVVSCTDASAEAAKVGYDRIKPIGGVADELERISEKEIELWRKVASYYLCSVGEVYKAAYPSMKLAQEETRARIEARNAERDLKARAKLESKLQTLRQRLARKDESLSKAKKESVIHRLREERSSVEASLAEVLESLEKLKQTAGPSDFPSVFTSPELSEAQLNAVGEINTLFKSGKPILLHGITGSGKTEIYLFLAARTISEGKNVLFLVPEITLSRQLEDRVREMFPNHLRVFHSAETSLGRFRTAEFMRRNPYLVLGTRSALFLPHNNLGLVVVDEEHDTSYKQDSPAPRYNARETAIMLSSIHSAHILLGSATPSLESIYNCSVGRFGLVRLSQRYFNASDSDVEIIDTQAELHKNGMVGSFSRKLIDHISDCLGRGGQILILRERRAYSPVMKCSSCGEAATCTRCNAPLSLHRRSDGRQSLVCHHCGRVYEYSGVCRLCGSPLVSAGAGTQKIEEEVHELFPQARVARLDSDSAQEKNYTSNLLRSFSKGEIDILVGTQMVAKGLDFSGVTLVAVLSADSVLSQGDYRADERGLQLLEQFRGRCGRRSEKGLFVVQVSHSDHPVCQALDGSVDHYSSLNRFLTERQVFGYPPYSREVNVVIRDYDEKRLDSLSSDLAHAISRSGMSPASKVIGPFPPSVDKVSGLHIRLIRVLLPKDRNLSSNKEILSNVVDVFSKEKKYAGRISLDVDPV